MQKLSTLKVCTLVMLMRYEIVLFNTKIYCMKFLTRNICDTQYCIVLLTRNEIWLLGPKWTLQKLELSRAHTLCALHDISSVPYSQNIMHKCFL